MEPTDIALIVALVIVVLAVLWLVANAQRHTSGTMDFAATWLATTLIVFVVGGGHAMFGVVVLLFLLGSEVARVGLAVVLVALVLEPFAVFFVLRYRGSHARSETQRRPTPGVRRSAIAAGRRVRTLRARFASPGGGSDAGTTSWRTNTPPGGAIDTRNARTRR